MLPLIRKWNRLSFWGQLREVSVLHNSGLKDGEIAFILTFNKFGLFMKNLFSFWVTVCFIQAITVILFAGVAKADAPPPHMVPQGIIVRTSENVTRGGWVFLLNECSKKNIRRIDLLVKQDEDHFQSRRTGQSLQSGELFVPLEGEPVAEGWESDEWLKQMIGKADELGIDIYAWWPCFHDFTSNKIFPEAGYSIKVKDSTEHFVDPAYSEITDRQKMLLFKLLETYDFDGVSLDWVRYGNWKAGSDGPLGEDFALQYGISWEDDPLKIPYLRGRWYEARAKLIATWVKEITEDIHARFPGIRVGAYVLPWQFSENCQSYFLLRSAGLDYFQPMIYWADWKKSPDYARQVLRRCIQLGEGTQLWPAIGFKHDAAEQQEVLSYLPADNLGGVSWFGYGTWESEDFDHLGEYMNATPRIFETQTASPTKGESKLSVIKSDFFTQTSLWSVICLSELYEKKALSSDRPPDPVIPVLAMHGVGDIKKLTVKKSETTWFDSRDFTEKLLGFLKEKHFNIIRFSDLQAYLMNGDPFELPSRSIVLTFDDGYDTILKNVLPLAKEYNAPIFVSPVCNWVDEASAKPDSATTWGGVLTWEEMQQLQDSGLVEFGSHSNGSHYWVGDVPKPYETGPALITRLWSKSEGRMELRTEYYDRVRRDMKQSRKTLQDQLGGLPPTVFVWPYGAASDTALLLARSEGYTHFLNYDEMRFVTIEKCRQNIPRISIVKDDEKTGFKMPEDDLKKQNWWLAFVKLAYDTKNPDMLEAALKQLNEEYTRTPEAQTALTELWVLQGHTLKARKYIEKLHEYFPNNPMVTEQWRRLL